MTYPSSIPEFNKFRVPTPDTVNLSDKVSVICSMPLDVVQFFFGGVSLNSDVNYWQEAGTLTPEQMVDIFNNEVVCILSSDPTFCDLVNSCLTTNQGVIDTVQDIIKDSQSTADEIAQNNWQGVTSEFTNDREAVCAGVEYLVSGIVDKANDILDVVDLFVDALDAASELIERFASPVSGLAKYAALGFELSSSALAITTTVLRNYVNDIGTADDLRCRFYCEIFQQFPDAPHAINETVFEGVRDDLRGGNLNQVFLGDAVDFLSWRSFVGRYNLSLQAGNTSNICDAVCDCQPTCVAIDFSVEDGLPLWQVENQPASWDAPFGVYAPGAGWAANEARRLPLNLNQRVLLADISRPIFGDLQSVTMTFDCVKGLPSADTQIARIIVDGNVVAQTNVDGVGQVLQWTGNINNAQTLRVQVVPQFNPTINPPASGLIKSVEWCYT